MGGRPGYLVEVVGEPPRRRKEGRGKLRQAVAMTAGLRLQSLTFSGDEQRALDVSGSDLIVLIGPNNAGKSRALREIETLLSSDHPGQVVCSLSAQRSGSADTFRDWVIRTAPKHDAGPGQPEHHLLPSRGLFNINVAMQVWADNAPLGELAQLMVFRADAETRLQLADSVQSVDIRNGQAIEPL